MRHEDQWWSDRKGTGRQAPPPGSSHREISKNTRGFVRSESEVLCPGGALPPSRDTGNPYPVPCSCVPCKCSVPRSFEKIFLIVPNDAFALTLFYNRSNFHRKTAMNYNSAVLSELNDSGRLRNFLHALRTALNSSSENLPSSWSTQSSLTFILI